MKKLLWLLIPAAFMLQACPMGLDYAMSETGTEPISKKLIGVWENENSKAEVLKIEFFKNTDNSLKAKVLDRGELYSEETDDYEVWQSTLNNKTFLIFKPKGGDKYYHYQIELKGNELIYNDVSLLDGGVDAVTSTKTLREQIANSIGKEEWGEEKSTMTRVN